MTVSASHYDEGEDSSAKEFGEKRRDGSHVVHLETELSFQDGNLKKLTHWIGSKNSSSCSSSYVATSLKEVNSMDILSIY